MRWCVVAFAILAWTLPALAVPVRVPGNTGEVLEHLPPRAPSRASGKYSADPLQAAEDVRNLLDLARRDGDPRYLGQAAAHLRPWRNSSVPPAEIRVLRARIAQADHRFEAALADLAAVPSSSAVHTEARLLEASIALVRGDAGGAAAACARIVAIDALPLALACQAQARGADGEAVRALADLERLAGRPAVFTPVQHKWVVLAIGDLASRLGDDQRAGRAYRDVSDSGPEALAAWADWLISHDRAAEAIALLEPERRHDGVLLRLTIARLQQGDPAARADRSELAGRHAAMARRGDALHLRERAMFALDVARDAGAALDLARRNFEDQREFLDARLYARAARAAGSAADVRRLLEWKRRTGFEDVILEAHLDTPHTHSASAVSAP